MLSVPSILVIYAVGVVGIYLLFVYELCLNRFIEKTRYSSYHVGETLIQKPFSKYLVNSASCKIPELNPFDQSISAFVRRVDNTQFYSRPLLTEIVFNPKTKETYLQLKRDSMKFYTKEDTVYCCISAIHPTRPEVKPERSLIYETLHATVVRAKRSKRKTKEKKTRLNVLVVGFDSMSRVNLYRTMPRTVTYLHTHGWSELRGYTKIADNTLPNLMALLTGIPPEKLRSPHLRYFDGYPFIWKEFAAAGYVTAYVEDNPSLGTFDCNLRGFSRSPTDYYPLNFFNLAETYMDFRKNSSHLGVKSSSDHLFNYLLDFTQAHSKDPFFGLFWVNDFSHNNLNQPSSEDDQVLKTLRKLEQQGTLNTTMLLFLSDHGLRVGNFRKTRIGWYEDRLPFFFLSIPEWYKTQNDHDFLHLLDNTDKLVSPFDVYKTLSHVLHGENLKDPIGCKTCHSLLTEIPSNRSCSDAGVSPHWCACHELVDLPVSRFTTKYWAELVVQKINNQLQKDTDLVMGYICVNLSLRNVLYFRKKLNTTELVIGIQTDPGGAEFEATILRRGYYTTVEDSISRLNEYGMQSHCARNPTSKSFCYCVDVGMDGEKSSFFSYF